MGQKVTFYNEISIQKPVGDMKVPGNSSSLSSNGIYFSPANDILQNQPPHIVQGQYIYTLGSRVINNTPEKPEERSIVSVINQNNTIEFKTKTDNDSLFVSDIESNQFDKTITIKKSAIDLSGITTPLKNIFDGLKSTDSSVRIDETTIRLYWDAEKGLQLSDSKLQPNNIYIVKNYNSDSYLTETTDNIISIFAYTDLTVTIPNVYNDYLKVENLTPLTGYNDGKVIKLKTNGTGWPDNVANTRTFSGFTIIAAEDGTYTSANQNDYSFALKKLESPVTFNNSIKYDVGEISFNLLDVTSEYKADNPNYTQKSLYNVNSSYCVVSDTDKTISIKNAYYISDDAYAIITVTDNTKDTDIYYKTSKDFTLYFSGAKQWGLVFNYNGASTSNVTKNAYYNKTFTFPENPTREGYTFDGWYTAQTDGDNVTGVKAGSSSYTWHETNYDITLYAHWTQNVKYYWYAGQTAPTSMTSNPTPDDTNFTVDKWHTLAKDATSIAKTITGGSSGNAWYIAVPTSFGFKPTATDLATLNNTWLTEGTISVNNVEYTLWKPSSTSIRQAVYMANNIK